MAKPKVVYRFTEISKGVYELYHGSLLLAKFSRQSFREVMEKVAVEKGLSSNWIGSILRLLDRAYPYVSEHKIRTDFERFVDKFKNEGIADYLRSKGFRVVKSVKFKDMDLIRYLEREGYQIEGFVGDVHYASPERLLGVS